MKKSELQRIIREETRKVLKEAELHEDVIRVFSYAKPYTKPDAAQLRAKADKFITKLQDKNYNTHTGSGVIYFPDFVWAGGKQKFGECFGAMAGSETMVIQPIDSDKTFKIGESLLARLMSDGRLVGYLLKGKE